MIILETKEINISGVCLNCDKRESCDFIKDIFNFLKESKSAENLVDLEISIFSCLNYGNNIDVGNDIINERIP